MKRFVRWGIGSLAAIFFVGTPVHSQSSLDILEKDLDQIKQEHQEASSQNFSNFLDTLEKSAADGRAALELYQQAGGNLPDPTPVKTQYENETPDEKAARLAQDAVALSNLEYELQLHCGMMRFAALFVVKPQMSTLHDDWIAWLKGAAQIYPQIDQPASPDADTGAPTDQPNPPHRSRKKREATSAPSVDMMKVALSDSIIGPYLGFNGWGDKEQGKWSVKDVPKFYREQVLEPLRAQPTAATLEAWDVYIAMESADQPDRNKWTQVDYPALQFDRACDDFSSGPGTEKLETLVGIIKANPSHPKVDAWIAQVHDMMEGYKKQRAGNTPAMAPTDFVQPDAPAPPPSATTNGAPQ